MGQLDHGIYLVEDVDDVARRRDPGGPAARGRDADDALGRRRGGDPRRGQAALPRGARAQAAGHLLRDAEPAGRGQDARARRRRAGRRRQPEQLEQQPPARARRAARRRRLHGRRRRRPEAPNGSKASAASASPPARRRPKSWCRRSSSGCARSARSRCAASPGAVETVHFPLPKGLGDKAMGTPLGELSAPGAGAAQPLRRGWKTSGAPSRRRPLGRGAAVDIAIAAVAAAAARRLGVALQEAGREPRAAAASAGRRRCRAAPRRQQRPGRVDGAADDEATTTSGLDASTQLPPSASVTR